MNWSELAGAVILFAGSVLAVAFFFTGTRVLLSDKGDYELNRSASVTPKETLRATIPTNEDIESGVLSQAGLAIDRHGNVVDQVALSDHAVDRILRNR